LPEPDLSDWERIVHTVRNSRAEVRIAVVGKYIELNDAYKSVYEALAHAGIANELNVKLTKLSSDELTPANAAELLSGMHGVCVPGGFGGRGIEGKIQAARWARESGVPYLGLCYGLHMAVIEFARNVCGLQGANSTEIDPDTPHPVICLLDSQHRITEKGGTMRLGAQPAVLSSGFAMTAYGTDSISERHRHRWEFNNSYREQLEAAGMAFTGLGVDTDLVEIIELPSHPWFVGVQFHPEFKSKPTTAHPLFRDFVKAAMACARGDRSGTAVAEPGQSSKA
jgi:CTP synthase